jgi:hypothetical protein
MYKIPVKIEGIERRKRSTGLLHVIAGFFLISNASTYFKHLNYFDFIFVSPFFIVGAASFVYGFFRRRLDPAAIYNHWLRMLQFLTFAILAVSFMSFASGVVYFGLFLWAVVTLFLMFTERKVFHDTVMQIKEDGIHVPGYFTSHVIPWHIVADFILRTDYVTISRTNLKYVQLELLGNIEADEVAAINDFSRQKILQYSSSLQTS